MVGIAVEELMDPALDYEKNVERITGLVEENRLSPVKSSGFNGKRPPLYNRYRQVKEKRDRKALISHIDALIEPPLSASFYKQHLVQFERDEALIISLQNWLAKHPDCQQLAPVSLNERSFEIFGQEKLLKSGGLRVCDNLNLPHDWLRFYQTDVPLAVFSLHNQPGPLLIVENLDPFVTMRHLLIEGHEKLLGFPLNTVGYGAGYGIERSLRDLLVFGTPELKASLDPVYYWGDLDYEGICIFENLKARYPQVPIVPWKPGYERMLAKGKTVPLPKSKEKQTRTEGEHFWPAFDPAFVQDAKALLESGRYIPQEILNRSDYLNHFGKEDTV